jgi:D-alanyl-D-alanine carboxypeptidase/D-alanyl-D-alanine-endopeptidase (penicillin-binding protein 4)
VPALASTLLAVALAAGPASGEAAGERGAAREALRAELERILSSPALASGRVGLLVRSLDTGEVVFARSPDELLNPASNVKLFTSAAALVRLGPEYRFETEFLLAPGGPGAGHLHVRGKGDPTFVHERLWEVAAALSHLGVARVGDIVLDDSWFDAEREGPGFDQERGDRAYLAPAGAISLDFNAVAVHVAPGATVGSPGRVSVEPASDHLQVVNRTVTARAGARRRVAVGSEPSAGRQRVTVEGRLPLGGRAQVFHRRIDDPPAFFGHTLRRFLELRGVKVAGKVRRGPVPHGSRLVHVSESEALADVVRRLNKHSNNFVAEQILKTLGAETRGPPGTWASGVAAVEAFLADVGIPRGSYLMKNGSGLNDANRFSARQTVTLLEDMWRRFPVMAEFAGALPVAARDGTTRWRMEGTEAAGRLRAKTGTLEDVSSLSGYVETRSGERLAFAILVNDRGRAAAAVKGVDQLAAALAAAGAAPPAPAVPPAGDPQDRVAAYYRLAEAGDRRNVPFLRTALRTESDPVLRMAAAEAAYLSDPDGEGSRRAFLESVTADPAALARLRELAPDRAAPPVVESLADLAAEGGLDAMVALREVTAAGPREELDRLWAEVAAVAPEETMVLLLSAPDGPAEAVAASLARGLRRAGPDGHAFLAELQRAAGGEGALAVQASALRERIGGRPATGGSPGPLPGEPAAAPQAAAPAPPGSAPMAPATDPLPRPGGG